MWYSNVMLASPDGELHEHSDKPSPVVDVILDKPFKSCVHIVHWNLLNLAGDVVLACRCTGQSIGNDIIEVRHQSEPEGLQQWQHAICAGLHVHMLASISLKHNCCTANLL